MPAGRPRKYDREKMREFILANPTATFTQIASEFGCSVATASTLYYKFFPEACPPATKRSLERQEAYRQEVQAREVQRQARKQAVIAYAQEHPSASYAEIATALNERLYYVSRVVKEAGLGPGAGYRRDGSTNQPGSLEDPESDRSKLIEQSLRENWTLKETGAKLGVTRERARQLRRIYISRYPTPEPEANLCVQQVADQIGANSALIRRIVQEKQLGRRRGMSQIIFSEEEAKQVQEAYLQAIRRTCENCGKVFFRASGGGRTRTNHRYYCSKECQSTFHNLRYVRGKADPLTPQTATVWKQLVEVLDPNRPPETEFVTAKQARDLTGASTMQLTYLRYRGIIRTQDHPTRKRMGTPYRLYSKSDIQTLREHMPPK